MKLIEFIGTSGAGKSTLMEELLSYESYVGGNEMYDVRYWGEEWKQESRKFAIMIHLLSYLPKSTRTKLGKEIYNKILWPRLFLDFVSKNERFIQELLPYLGENYPEQSKEKIKGFAGKIAKYELGRRIDHSSKYICLTEGFYHRTRAVNDIKNLPDDSYFDLMPTPSVLVWVEPPPEIIYERKDARDGIEYTIDSIEKSRQINRLLVEKASERGARIIKTKNIETPKKEAREIHNQIND